MMNYIADETSHTGDDLRGDDQAGQEGAGNILVQHFRGSRHDAGRAGQGLGQVGHGKRHMMNYIANETSHTGDDLHGADQAGQDGAYHHVGEAEDQDGAHNRDFANRVQANQYFDRGEEDDEEVGFGTYSRQDANLVQADLWVDHGAGGADELHFNAKDRLERNQLQLDHARGVMDRQNDENRQPRRNGGKTEVSSQGQKQQRSQQQLQQQQRQQQQQFMQPQQQHQQRQQQPQFMQPQQQQQRVGSTAMDEHTEEVIRVAANAAVQAVQSQQTFAAQQLTGLMGSNSMNRSTHGDLAQAMWIPGEIPITAFADLDIDDCTSEDIQRAMTKFFGEGGPFAPTGVYLKQILGELTDLNCGPGVDRQYQDWRGLQIMSFFERLLKDSARFDGLCDDAPTQPDIRQVTQDAQGRQLMEQHYQIFAPSLGTWVYKELLGKKDEVTTDRVIAFRAAIGKTAMRSSENLRDYKKRFGTEVDKKNREFSDRVRFQDTEIVGYFVRGVRKHPSEKYSAFLSSMVDSILANPQLEENWKMYADMLIRKAEGQYGLPEMTLSSPKQFGANTGGVSSGGESDRCSHCNSKFGADCFCRKTPDQIKEIRTRLREQREAKKGTGGRREGKSNGADKQRDGAENTNSANQKSKRGELTSVKCRACNKTGHFARHCNDKGLKDAYLAKMDSWKAGASGNAKPAQQTVTAWAAQLADCTSEKLKDMNQDQMRELMGSLEAVRMESITRSVERIEKEQAMISGLSGNVAKLQVVNTQTGEVMPLGDFYDQQINGTKHEDVAEDATAIQGFMSALETSVESGLHEASPRSDVQTDLRGNEDSGCELTMYDMDLIDGHGSGNMTVMRPGHEVILPANKYCIVGLQGARTPILTIGPSDLLVEAQHTNGTKCQAILTHGRSCTVRGTKKHLFNPHNQMWSSARADKNETELYVCFKYGTVRNTKTGLTLHMEQCGAIEEGTLFDIKFAPAHYKSVQRNGDVVEANSVAAAFGEQGPGTPIEAPRRRPPVPKRAPPQPPMRKNESFKMSDDVRCRLQNLKAARLAAATRPNKFQPRAQLEQVDGHGGSQKRTPNLRSAVSGLQRKLQEIQRQGHEPSPQGERAPTDSGRSAMDSMAARVDAAMKHVEPQQPVNGSIHQKSGMTQSAGQHHEHQSAGSMSSSARSRNVLQVQIPRTVVGVQGDFSVDVHEEADEREILEICELVQDQRGLSDEQGDRMVDYVRDAVSGTANGSRFEIELIIDGLTYKIPDVSMGASEDVIEQRAADVAEQMGLDQECEESLKLQLRAATQVTVTKERLQQAMKAPARGSLTLTDSGAQMMRQVSGRTDTVRGSPHAPKAADALHDILLDIEARDIDDAEERENFC
jgi:hypothetical protein